MGSKYRCLCGHMYDDHLKGEACKGWEGYECECNQFVLDIDSVGKIFVDILNK